MGEENRGLNWRFWGKIKSVAKNSFQSPLQNCIACEGDRLRQIIFRKIRVYLNTILILFFRLLYIYIYIYTHTHTHTHRVCQKYVHTFQERKV